MECEKKGSGLLIGLLLVGLLSDLVVTTASRSLDGFGDQKNYYPPDPHARSPPRRSHGTPSCPTPSHGGTAPPSRGGGGYVNPPAPPRGGGGYYNPPTPAVTLPPSPPYEPITPAVPPTASTPTIPSPSTPFAPTIPSPPFVPYDPSNPSPGTCNYWRTHPAVVWGVLGYWGTVGQFFGLPAATALGRNLSLLEALSNTRGDGIGALFREGTASLLNSMVDKRFAFTTQQVKDAFSAATASNRAAAAQAQLFKKANEGHLKSKHV